MKKMIVGSARAARRIENRLAEKVVKAWQTGRMTTCGECRECCVRLPILESGWKKQANVPCEKLGENGCSIFRSKELPKLCRKYLCLWRVLPGLGNDIANRPDQLGVIFHEAKELVTAHECRPGALDSAPVREIMANIRKTGKRVFEMTYDCHDGIEPSELDKPGLVRGTVERTVFGWRRRAPTNRISLPVLAA